MKLVKCIIRPNKVDDVREAVEKASVSGMTITEVRGHGRQKGHKAVYRGREYDVSLLPKTMIEMAVPDELVDEVIAVVMRHARTGDIGDGRIWVLGIEEGSSPSPLLIGLAVLGLFAEAADEEPLVCVVDDTQWADGMSAAVLAFVARRLDAEAVALVFAVNTTAASDLAVADSRLLAGLPELRVERLGADDARELLDSLLPGPVDPGMRDRIVAESHGNPLALVVLSRGGPWQGRR